MHMFSNPHFKKSFSVFSFYYNFVITPLSDIWGEIFFNDVSNIVPDPGPDLPPDPEPEPTLEPATSPSSEPAPEVTL